MPVKLETSPAESLLSAPCEVYSSLFQKSASPSTPATPQSLQDDEREDSMRPGDDGTPDKKPAKKRKSWGQVLPEPKTNLPPRKRAKTEDEKEQRRVERVLRNRRAAQSSRERKRLEVEALEERNKELENLLLNAQKENLMLYQRLTQAEGKSAVMTSSRNSPVTLSQELFSSQDGHATLLGGFLGAHDAATIDPLSLSPPLNPVRDSNELTIKREFPCAAVQPAPLSMPLAPPAAAAPPAVAAVAAASASATATATTTSVNPSPDMTQRPAATLCNDLQCLSAEESQGWTVPQSWTVAQTAFVWQLMLLSSLSSMALLALHHPLKTIALCLKRGFSIPPTRAVLTLIIWLATRPCRRSSARASTSTTSSMRTGHSPTMLATMASPAPASRRLPNRPVSTLRRKVLRKILTCNPMLARPLADATMRVLRSVCSEKPLAVVRVDGQAGAADAWEDGAWPWPYGAATQPSREVLMALLWTLRMYEKRGMAALSSSRQDAKRVPKPEDLSVDQSQAQADADAEAKAGQKRRSNVLGRVLGKRRRLQ